MLPDPKKEKPSSPRLSLLVDMTDPDKVLDEVNLIFQDMFDKGDFTFLSAVFGDVVALFFGRFPGYKACDTPYHNLKHTTDVFLAMARLVHGAHLQGLALNEMDVTLGLTAALMHDTGYIQKDSETHATGAELATVHVRRGIAFMQHYLSEARSPEMFRGRSEALILCTDLEYPFARLTFSTDVDKTMAQMIAASDLLAQTADRNYLEKLPLLFRESQASKTGSFENELGLIEEAPRFNDFMRHRIANELGGVDRYLRPHFKRRWGIDQNMYQEAIDRSLAYLSAILTTDSGNYHQYFRRIKGR